MLITDWLIWGLVLIALIVAFLMRKNPQLRIPWQQICRRKISMIALVIISFYATAGLLDSIHLRITYKNQTTRVVSLLDMALGGIAYQQEKSYSKPFATQLYSQSLVTLPNGTEIRTYPRLKYAGASLKNPQQDRASDIALRIAIGFAIGFVSVGGGHVAFVFDLNNDGITNILDLVILLTNYGSQTGQTNYNTQRDYNNDGRINIIDLALHISNW
jgi:peptide/nickel transport system permease protein